MKANGRDAAVRKAESAGSDFFVRMFLQRNQVMMALGDVRLLCARCRPSRCRAPRQKVSAACVSVRRRCGAPSLALAAGSSLAAAVPPCRVVDGCGVGAQPLMHTSGLSLVALRRARCAWPDGGSCCVWRHKQNADTSFASPAGASRLKMRVPPSFHLFPSMVYAWHGYCHFVVVLPYRWDVALVIKPNRLSLYDCQAFRQPLLSYLRH